MHPSFIGAQSRRPKPKADDIIVVIVVVVVVVVVVIVVVVVVVIAVVVVVVVVIVVVVVVVVVVAVVSPRRASSVCTGSPTPHRHYCHHRHCCQCLVIDSLQLSRREALLSKGNAYHLYIIF
jgi:hypothetical protein